MKKHSEARKNLSRSAANGETRTDEHGKTAAYSVCAERQQALKKAALEKEMQPIFSEFDGLFKALAEK